MALVAWQKFITDAAGNIIDGAEVRVYDPGTTTKNAIYKDRSGSTQWTDNVALSDANGMVLLYVANGRYDIEVTKGSSTVLYEDVLLSEIQALDVGKDIGDVPQYEDDGDGNPVLDHPNAPQVSGTAMVYIVDSVINNDNGWIEWSNGLMEQWGMDRSSYSTSAQSDQRFTISFHKAFNAAPHVSWNILNDTEFGGERISIGSKL